MKKISILGCGWLGLPIATALVKKGFVVNGSTTSADKISILKQSKIEPFLISVSSLEINGDFTSFLENSEILLIDIPPKLRGINKESFIDKINLIIPFIEKSSVKKVLFTSSTSVYADKSELITEETIEKPDTESGKQLVQTEQLLKNNLNFKTTIVRFGGLIGEDRHPIHSLSRKDNIENPDAPINLIHQDDCIGIILKIIETNCWGTVFNAVTPFHPSREDYYTQKATAMNLDLPKFNHKIPSIGKTVLSDKVVHVLNYKFIRSTL